MEQKDKLSIDLGKIDADGKNEATLAAADNIYQNITAWLRSGGLQSGDNQKAALLLFTQNTKDDPRTECDILKIGNGLVLAQATGKAAKDIITASGKTENACISAALLICMELLEPYEGTQDEALQRLLAMLGMVALNYALKTGKEG